MSRTQLYKKVAEKALDIEAKTWGSRQQYTMSHMLFGGTLPKFLGFDRGPITAVGGRATIHQGQIYKSAGRTTTFFPSLRMVTEMGSDMLYSNLAGGPSDNRFSKWYISDLKNWQNYWYKETRAEGGDELDF